eukprot:8127705-Pyramimonas_sp.AAC.1
MMLPRTSPRKANSTHSHPLANRDGHHGPRSLLVVTSSHPHREPHRLRLYWIHQRKPCDVPGQLVPQRNAVQIRTDRRGVELGLAVLERVGRIHQDVLGGRRQDRDLNKLTERYKSRQTPCRRGVRDITRRLAQDGPSSQNE